MELKATSNTSTPTRHWQIVPSMGSLCGGAVSDTPKVPHTRQRLKISQESANEELVLLLWLERQKKKRKEKSG
ncbi:hypothetical protein ACJ73_05991 [Blastomyces percursus]|uniref:Uncharacterized protein n=1 Tax=Blastomyces percursus TaxID=1658174 RepID=A0A1J9Q219_9EURO|nr:hypothetical protein ACJ73_05991 [Blastomyces percursus]